MLDFKLRDYQEACVEHDRTCEDSRVMYAAPTGTGKSYPELINHKTNPDNYLITPSLEIISDLLLKLTGERYSKPSSLLPLARRHNITTPTRLRNELLKGNIRRINKLTIDEVHHSLAETYIQVLMMLDESTKIRGYTATPFRGTPKGSAELREQWGEPIWLITITDAIKQGFFKMPKCHTVPLIDDDIIEMTNGEFQVETVKRETESKLRDIGDLVIDKGLNIPTMVSMPTRDNVYALDDYLKTKNFPCRVITDKTDTKSRHQYFKECEQQTHVLLQIKAVSEGNDIKVYRLIDCTPNMSPVAFMQRFGRICRPTDKFISEYYCTNRNLLRHAYLFEGNLPVYEYNESKKAFITDSKRMGCRAWDIESMGRFKPSKVPFASGVEGEVYSIVKQDGNFTETYTAIVHPLVEDVIWGMKRSTKGTYDGTYKRLANAPDSVKGFTSKSGQLTPAQEDFYRKKAESFGLDKTTKKLDKRIFDVMVALKDMRVRIK